ncbi:hypothetical protein ABZ621_36705 [Streptomyces sp. NPDC007863]|uniref:hypothetical protein n=1 Tax=Streptomyces sp. NPDC007863 TaxID=3154894 RepID=UPI0033D470FC
MPWVRLDDRFPSHRKVALLSDRAFRLYVSALCWSSENLTEGRILEKELPLVTRVRGPKTAAAELEAAGLWDRAEVGWVIHDYLEYNPDRAKVKAEREANAARQKAFRERKKAEREAKRNGDRNGVTPPPDSAPDDTTEARRRHDGDTNAQQTGSENQSSSQVSGIRNGVSNGAPSRPVLPSPSEKEKEDVSKTEGQPSGAAIAHIGDRPRIPVNCEPLVVALQAANLFVGWELAPNEWLLIEALIRRCGIPALVTSANASWQGARTPPRSGRYFLPAWRQLPDAAPAGTPVPALAPVPKLTGTDARVAGWGAIAAQFAAEDSA